MDDMAVADEDMDIVVEFSSPSMTDATPANRLVNENLSVSPVINEIVELRNDDCCGCLLLLLLLADDDDDEVEEVDREEVGSLLEVVEVAVR